MFNTTLFQSSSSSEVRENGVNALLSGYHLVNKTINHFFQSHPVSWPFICKCKFKEVCCILQQWIKISVHWTTDHQIQIVYFIFKVYLYRNVYKQCHRGLDICPRTAPNQPKHLRKDRENVRTNRGNLGKSSSMLPSSKVNW